MSAPKYDLTATCEGLDAEGYFHPHEADSVTRVQRGGVHVDLCPEHAGATR